MRKTFPAIAALVAVAAIIPAAVALAQPGPEADPSSAWQDSDEWVGHHEEMLEWMESDEWVDHHEEMYQWMADHWDDTPTLTEESSGPTHDDDPQRQTRGRRNGHCAPAVTDRGAAGASLGRGPRA